MHTCTHIHKQNWIFLNLHVHNIHTLYLFTFIDEDIVFEQGDQLWPQYQPMKDQLPFSLLPITTRFRLYCRFGSWWSLVHRGNKLLERYVIRPLWYEPLLAIENRHLCNGRAAALSYGEGTVGGGPEEGVDGLHLADEGEVLDVFAHHVLCW